MEALSLSLSPSLSPSPTHSLTHSLSLSISHSRRPALREVRASGVEIGANTRVQEGAAVLRKCVQEGWMWPRSVSKKSGCVQEVCPWRVGVSRNSADVSRTESVTDVPPGMRFAVLNLRTTTSQKCEAVPRRARM